MRGEVGAAGMWGFLERKLAEGGEGGETVLQGKGPEKPGLV